MTWVLVLMICSRGCAPQYAETYPSRETCMAKVPPYGTMQNVDRYCVPLIKETK